MTFLNRLCVLTVLLASVNTCQADIYLNSSNINVALGPSMVPNPFVNRTTAASLASVIDAPSAVASEFHSQSTHIWVSQKPLELDFSLNGNYDLKSFHFWNYHGETWDVDDIDLRFYDSSKNLVGSLLNISPALGNSTGFDSTPIFAQNFTLNFSNVRYVNAMVSGSNGEIDFNNIGFTGVASVPEPASCAFVIAAALGLFKSKRWRERAKRDLAK